MLRPFKDVTVSFGAPMHADGFGPTGHPRLLRKMTDAVMFEIAQMTGQDYVHTYAGTSTDSDHPATMPERRPAVIRSHPPRGADDADGRDDHEPSPTR